MADLIDRDAVLHDISTECSNAYEAKYYEAQVALTRAKRIICDAPAVNRWIPCSEKRPDLWGEYLTYNAENGAMYVLSFSPADNTFGIYDGNVTHWMPLPEPPKEDET